MPANHNDHRDTGPFPLVGHDLVIDGVAAAYGAATHLRSIRLLIDGALEAGVELGNGFTARVTQPRGNA